MAKALHGRGFVGDHSSIDKRSNVRAIKIRICRLKTSRDPFEPRREFRVRSIDTRQAFKPPT